MTNSDKFYEQRHEQLGHLPGDILLSIATNESAEPRWRKAAVELMLELKHPQVNKPEIAPLLAEVKKDRYAKDEVIDVVETAIEQPIETSEIDGTACENNSQSDEEGLGPLFASVTTQSLSQ